MIMKMCFLILVVILGIISAEFNHRLSSNRRRKRYLVYPFGDPARAQFIIGLGIPVDLKDQSVTVGTVIKFQYVLPSNSTQYTNRIFGFANTVSRGMDNNEVAAIDHENGVEETKNLNHNESYVARNELEDFRKEDSHEENVLVDIDFSNEHGDRKRRSVDNKGTEIPLEEAIRIQEELDEEEIEPRRANRWEYYKIIESMIERYGLSGRPCLLRTICEAAEVPFTHHSGLLAEIGHVLFTPSTTTDELSHHTDNEYHAAEKLGKQDASLCEKYFPECESSILETFTQIGFDTLHRFGIY